MVIRSNRSRRYFWQCRELKTPLTEQHFDLGYWRNTPDYSELSGGRGATARITVEDRAVILRRYYRGGLVSKLLTDQYLWLGRSRTRPWRECRALEHAYHQGLPVPQPIAAYVCRQAGWYRAAIMTEYIANTETLAARLRVAGAASTIWEQLGQLIRQLHEARICHPDLNLTNILIDDVNRLYLIDFDRARVRSRLGDWQWGALHRLKRSLDKFNRRYRPDHAEDDWQVLMDGYQG